ncbi:SCO2522 family protein [Nocardia sp. CDC159]|uniref:SCO2522 family protein n=1 Tax=Nocardia pulmonis TaxID=2951408 RepID=A0A9X2E9E0_9NOCA|nr:MULTISPECIES: SCO2522 family protein [Nocardia]MCM6774226.1 SCO2522 family protein [Nocardia pulmonis]MCM6787113.1 SCO2522 family protein [Nocardia sp. CDC159]
MRPTQTYTESTEQPWIEPVPMSHLSIEVGHFYLNDILGDPEHLKSEFRRMVPLVTAFVESARLRFGRNARVSTCYLLDDYFQPDTDAAETIARLLAAADAAGLGIDYLARESGCWRSSGFADGVPLGEPIPVAELVAARIVAEPAPPDTGSRPPTAESGWLCNGRRSSEYEPAQAMHGIEFQPPEEFGRREHSIFLDVQLWSTHMIDGQSVTRWSCPFLAAVWHLLRLGMLRYHGAAVVDPYPWRPDDPWPRRWHDVPPVVRLDPDAPPFAAYQTLSMLPKRYIAIEHAVRVILDHLDLDDDVVDGIIAQGAQDEAPFAVPRRVSERLSHLLLDGS